MGFIFYLVFGIIGLLILVFAVFFLRISWETRPRRPKDDGYRYIRVKEDGSVREVTPEERKYLETEFLLFDGARPYIKTRYETLNGWGSMAGFLPRRQLPKDIPIEQLPPKVESYEENEFFGEIDESKMVEARKKLSEIFDENLDDIQ